MDGVEVGGVKFWIDCQNILRESYETLELGFECECGRFERRGIMRHNFIYQRNCTSKDAVENWRNRKEQKYRKNQGVRWLPSSSSLKK